MKFRGLWRWFRDRKQAPVLKLQVRPCTNRQARGFEDRLPALKADDEVTRLKDALLQVDERAAGAEYDCGLLRAEIKALEDEIELCPAEGYHTNPAGLSHLS